MTTENLLEQFLGTSDFLFAYRRIASKKVADGLDVVAVKAFGRRLGQHISRLQKEIRERRLVEQFFKLIISIFDCRWEKETVLKN